jgi:hypothetical protein
MNPGTGEVTDNSGFFGSEGSDGDGSSSDDASCSGNDRSRADSCIGPVF